MATGNGKPAARVGVTEELSILLDLHEDIMKDINDMGDHREIHRAAAEEAFSETIKAAYRREYEGLLKVAQNPPPQ